MRKLFRKAICEILREDACAVLTGKKLRKRVFSNDSSVNARALVEDEEFINGTKHERKKIFQEVLYKLVKNGKIFQCDKFIGIDRESVVAAAAASGYGGKEKESDTTNKSKKRKRNEQDNGEDDRNGDEKEEARLKHLESMTPSEHQLKQQLSDRQKGSVTLLLFYAYCTPEMTRGQQDAAISYCYEKLRSNGCTGRLRVAREGFNSTLTGSYQGIRNFTASLREYDPNTFGETDFKYVDDLPDNHKLKDFKVFPVSEIVTYGFSPKDAPLEKTGIHLPPTEFHKALEDKDVVVIDVRNFNETLIGKFVAPNGEVLDPCMRRSTEFPKWVENNKSKLKDKKVLMYCTGGVRCERASAFVKNKGIKNVYQLEGGIHRYLEAYPEDGGHWIGKNYTFDKRFSHGAERGQVISSCVNCKQPWERYNAHKKCHKCGMEVIVCKTCDRMKPPVRKETLFCPLCEK